MTGHEMPGLLPNHLWQSTVFVIVAALVTLVFRKNRAHVRYCLWLSASVKFLVPFALLMALGNRLWSTFAARHIASELAPPAVSLNLNQLAQPFPDTLLPSAPLAHTISWIPAALLAVWLCGFLCIVFFRLRGWLRIRRVLRASTPIDIRAAAAVRSSPGLLEPGVVGLLRPILLLPQDISKRLSPSQLEAVLAHELSHIRRRDNLTAAIHMVVEAVFWFHPFVWWIGARLIEERERACDEAVLSLGGEPRDYADAILSVCKLYVESPLTCVVGISGADLKKRIVRIMARHVGLRMSLGRKLLLGAAALLAVAVPVVFGALTVTPSRAQSQPQNSAAPSPTYQYEAATIKSSKGPGPGGRIGMWAAPDGFSAWFITLQQMIAVAYGVERFQISGGPGWLPSERFDIEAKMDAATVDALGKLSQDQRVLARQQMLQALLADRFQLTVNRETNQLTIYKLVIAKGGSKLQEAQPDGAHPGAGSMRGSVLSGEVAAQAVPIARLARDLTQMLGHPVLDKTELKGVYDFKLQFTPDDRLQPPSGLAPDQRLPVPPADSNVPSLFDALQEQLGLKLEPGKGPVEVIAVDRVEKPSAN